LREFSLQDGVSFSKSLTDQVSLKMFPQIKSETGKTGLEIMVISL
jgi:hypothetical protein